MEDDVRISRIKSDRQASATSLGRDRSSSTIHIPDSAD
jgi:hypothetical protein